jgi:ankyrin repeat protein
MTVRVDSAGHKTVTRKRAIHVAAEDGHAAVVAELLAAGADAHALAAIEAPESTALTSALFNAQRNQHADVVALLEAAGCEAVSTVGVAV